MSDKSDEIFWRWRKSCPTKILSKCFVLMHCIYACVKNKNIPRKGSYGIRKINNIIFKTYLSIYSSTFLRIFNLLKYVLNTSKFECPSLVFQDILTFKSNTTNLFKLNMHVFHQFTCFCWDLIRMEKCIKINTPFLL